MSFVVSQLGIATIKPLAMGERTIELRLKNPYQLFNSLDPSPFRDRDLDSSAEAYVVDSADEYPLADRLRLLIHLPAAQVPVGRSLQLEQAIHNYFAYRRTEMQRRVRFSFRDGRVALLIGIIFLVTCISLRQAAVLVFPDTSGRIVQESLLILGWVAMWRPLQAFLYDWWPLRHRARLYRKLSEMTVEIREAYDDGSHPTSS